MVFQKGGRPSPCKAGDDLPIEPPTKAPDDQFTAKRQADARLVEERPA
jgi:hypothetical protein